MRSSILILLCVFVQLHATFAQKKQTEVGLNITTTLAGFFNTQSDAPLDPYLFMLRKGRKNKYFRMGLNFALSTRTDPDFGIDRLIRTQAWNLRMGREYRIPVSEKFLFYWGVDGVLDIDWERVEANFGFNSFNNLSEWTIGLGLGPIAGIRFNINQRMYLSTETYAYAIYSLGRRTLDGFDPNTGRSDRTRKNIRNFSILPAPPNSLYFNFIF